LERERELLKLTAEWLNTASVGALITGFIEPIMSAHTLTWAQWAWFLGAAALHFEARWTLAELE
jgi:hypothetical protein